MVIGTGEKLSCAMFTAILESRGIHAVYVPLDRCVDAGTAQAFDELDQKFYDQVRRVTAATVERKAMKGGGGGEFAVPVVTGYMGYIPGGIVEAIGRGYCMPMW